MTSAFDALFEELIIEDLITQGLLPTYSDLG